MTTVVCALPMDLRKVERRGFFIPLFSYGLSSGSLGLSMDWNTHAHGAGKNSLGLPAYGWEKIKNTLLEGRCEANLESPKTQGRIGGHKIIDIFGAVGALKQAKSVLSKGLSFEGAPCLRLIQAVDRIGPGR